MSARKKTDKAYKAGKDWWGKRPLSNTSVSSRSKTMKFWKRLLHKIERRQGKDITDSYLNE